MTGTLPNREQGRPVQRPPFLLRGCWLYFHRGGSDVLKLFSIFFIQLICLTTSFAQQPSYKVLWGEPRCNEGFYDVMGVRGANSGLTIYIDVAEWRRLTDENFRTQVLEAAFHQNLDYCKAKGRNGSAAVVVVQYQGDSILLAWTSSNDRSWHITLDKVRETRDREQAREARSNPTPPPVPPQAPISTTSNPTSTTSKSSGGGISIDGISGFIFFVGIIGFAFYWLYYRWTSKELPVQKLISAEETARDRAELKLLQEQAQLPKLPPPVLPERPPSPVTGIMRVDVTQTDKTVDVFVVLSEQSKFIVEKHDLANIPIEENLDGLQTHLREHMMRYSDDYDFDTKVGIQDTVEYRDPTTQAIHKEVMRDANQGFRAEREAEKKYKLREEQERETKYYMAAHTVLLGQYLTNPYRKIVSNRLEANQYLAQLEKEYLPKIKALLESAPVQGQKSYDF